MRSFAVRMADETSMPLEQPVTGPSQPQTSDRTDGSVSETGANSAQDDAETPIFEPVYENDPKAYYKALRHARPDERIGQIIRRVRDAQGLSVGDIHARTHLSTGKLVSLERMEVSSLPRGPVGPLVRAYASELGLDTDTVVRDYTEDCGILETVNAPEPVVAPETTRRMALSRPATAIAAALGLAFVFGAVFMLADGPDTVAGPALATQPLNGAAESLFTDVPVTERVRVEHMELTLVALEDAWVEVRGPDGTLYRNRIMRAGETYIPRSGAGWTISARNGAAFEWRVGDAVVGPLGPQDAAVFAASVDAAASRAKEAATPALAAAGNGQPSR